MAFSEQFFIAKPVAAGTVEVKFDGKTKALPAYRDTDGQILIWADHDGTTPLPEVGQKIMVTMNNLGPAVVKGYFRGGDPEKGEVYLGVMTALLFPPRWLREQNKQHEGPQWSRDGIGCEFATEFRPYQTGDTAKHRQWLKETRAKNKGTMWEKHW